MKGMTRDTWLRRQEYEHAIAKKSTEQAIRDAILVGRAELMDDGYYRIAMPDATYIYGAEYVKRILEWRDHS